MKTPKKVKIARELQVPGGPELVHKRTLRSKTYDLGNNRRMVRLGSSALHYRDDKGHLVDCDYTAEDNNGHGLIAKANYRLRIDKKRPAYRYQSLTGKSVSVELVQIGGQSVTDIDVQHDGRRHTYADIAQDTDYVITALSQGVRTDLVLKSASAPRTWRWDIMGDTGMIQPLVGQDASGKRLEINTTYGDGFIEAAWTGRAQDRRMARRNEWTEEVAYPVRVDPTVNEAITDGADDVENGHFYKLPGVSSEATNQYGTAASIVIGTGFSTISNFAAIRFGGLRFQAVAIPPGATVDSAVLTIAIVSVQGSPVIKVFGADVDDAAAWGTATNFVKDITKTTAAATFTPTASGTGYTVNVQSIVAEIIARGGWASGNDLALGLFPGNTPITNSASSIFNSIGIEAFDAEFSSNEATLDITYTAAASFQAAWAHGANTVIGAGGTH